MSSFMLLYVNLCRQLHSKLQDTAWFLMVYKSVVLKYVTANRFSHEKLLNDMFHSKRQ